MRRKLIQLSEMVAWEDLQPASWIPLPRSTFLPGATVSGTLMEYSNSLLRTAIKSKCLIIGWIRVTLGKSKERMSSIQSGTTEVLKKSGTMERKRVFGKEEKSSWQEPSTLQSLDTEPSTPLVCGFGRVCPLMSLTSRPSTRGTISRLLRPRKEPNI